MALVRLYLLTNDRIVRLERTIEFARIPAVGEWLRFESSGLLPHEITEVIHDEKGNAEIVIGAQRDDETGRYLLHESDEALEGDVRDLVSTGWIVKSEKPNIMYRNDV